MKKILLFVCLISTRVEAQVLCIDKLVAKIYYSELNIQKTDTVAFVRPQKSNIIFACEKNSNRGFVFFIYDSDTKFIDFLRGNKSCLLIRVIILNKTRNTLKLRLLFSSTNFEAYTNPNGPILGEIDDREITLILNKKKCQWE